MFYEKKIYKSNELKLLWGSDGNTFKKRLYYQLKTNKFIKIRRGIYVVFDQLYNLKESDYRMIANSIYIPSYVSFETVLRDEGVIFQRYTSIFVACKYTKTITIPVYKGLESVKVQCLKMPEELLANPLGIKTKDGYNIATLERALCDIFWKYESFYLDNLTPQMTRLSRLMEIAELYDIYKPGFKEALFTKLKVYGITATIST